MHPANERCAAWHHERWGSVRRDLSSDVARFLDYGYRGQEKGHTLRRLLVTCAKPKFLSLFVYRVSHVLAVRGWTGVAILLSHMNLFVHKVRIPPQSCIGPGCYMPHPAALTFCGTAGRDLTMYARSACCPREPLLEAAVDKGPRLGDRVTIGGHVAVIGSITVGDDTKIVPGTRLDRDAPAGRIVLSRVMRPTSRPRAAADDEPL